MDDSTRRRFLRMSGIAGTVGFAGCSQLTGGSDIKDSDGDGVIDSEDYAPRDASVQRAEQVQEATPSTTTTEEQTPTETVTESQQPTETETETQSPTEEPTDTPANDRGGNIIDDFETGSLEPEWRGVDGAGRSGFSVQSGVAPEGSFALLGGSSRSESSSIARDDFTINTDGASLHFYLRLGSVLTGYERANKLRVMAAPIDSDDLREDIIMFDQKDRSRDPNPDFTPPEGQISTRKLRTVKRVELNNINFSDNSVGEIRIGGETYAENVEFIENHSEISRIRIANGEFGSQTNVLVDRISYRL